MKIFTPSLLLFGILYSASSFAIRGDLLPESELPHNVCKITIGTLRHILQPTDKNGTPLKNLKAVLIDTPNQFVCSSNLIASDTILTAAHCFQGNNEWKVFRGRFQYPKLGADGNRIQGCQGDDYQSKPECVDHEQYGTLTERWLDTRVECPKEDGSGFESRPLKLEMGYSHPLYSGTAKETRHNTSNSIANFDISFYKLETPISNIKPMDVAWDSNDILKTLQGEEFENPNSLARIDQCRSFGYGNYDFHEGNAVPTVKYGVLHGANTPVSKFHTSFIESIIDANYPLPGVGWVDHGDSGGAIMCKGRHDHHYRLFGVVSRGINRSEIEKAFENGAVGGMSLEDSEDIKSIISRSDYTLPSYNQYFLEYTQKNGQFPRPLDTQYWYNLYGPYVKQQILNEFNQTNQCIQKHKTEMGKTTYKDYRKHLEAIVKVFNKAIEISQQYGNDQGLFLAKVSEFKVLETNRNLEWDCRNGIEY